MGQTTVPEHIREVFGSELKNRVIHIGCIKIICLNSSVFSECMDQSLYKCDRISTD